jgi:hypothetical protein
MMVQRLPMFHFTLIPLIGVWLIRLGLMVFITAKTNNLHNKKFLPDLIIGSLAWQANTR